MFKELAPRYKITLLYVIFGLCWIYFGDYLLIIFFNESQIDEILFLQTVKGFVYVFLTAALLFFLIKSSYKKLQNQIDSLEVNKELQTEVIASQENLSSVMEVSTDGYILLDDQFVIQGFNQQADKFVQYTMHKSLKNGMPIFDFLISINQEKMTEILNVVKRNKVLEFEKEYDLGGRFFFISYKLATVKGKDGSEGICIIGRDITKFKEDQKIIEATNEVLSKEKQRNENIINQSLDIICTFDNEGNIVDINRTACKLLGYEHGEMMGQTFNKFVHPEDIEKTIETAKSIMEGQNVNNYQNRWLAKDGEVVHLSWAAVYSPKEGLTFSTGRDASAQVEQTERSQVQNKLIDIFTHENSFEVALDQASTVLKSVTGVTSVGIWVPNLDGKKITIWGADGITKYRPDEKKYPIFAYINDSDVGEVIKTREKLMLDSASEIQSLSWLEFTDNHFSKLYHIPLTIDHKVVAIITFIAENDLSIEKIDKAIRWSSNIILLNIQKFRTDKELNTFFELSMDFHAILDFRSRIIKMNSIAKENLDIINKDGSLKKLEDVIHPDDLDNSFKIFREQLKSDENQFNVSHRLKLKNGVYKWFHWTANISREEGVIFAVAKGVDELRTVEEIKSYEERYKTLFHENPSPIIICHHDTYDIVEVNFAALNLYGYDKEDILNLNYYDLTDEIDQHTKESDITQRVVTHKNANGNIFYADIYTNEINFFGERMLLILVNDITPVIEAENELLESNKRYKLVSRAVEEAIWDYNPHTKKIVWGEGLTRLFGHSIKEFSKDLDSWENYVHPDDLGYVKEKMLMTIRDPKQEKWEIEYRFLKSDGTYANVMDRGFFLKNEKGRVYRSLGAMQDVTVIRQNEKMLRELNQSLSKRAEELEQSNKDLENFAYIASHDLQEPLRMISGFLELLNKKYSSELDEKALKYVEMAVDGAKRMSGLINDLLKYSRVGTSKESRTDVDLNEVVKSTIAILKLEIDESNAEIEIDQLPTIKANEFQMKQLFQNLISNALKYKSDKPLQIQINSSQDEEFWRIDVIDNGIGIEEKFYEKIFLIFQRLHTTKSYSGTGIGLAICKRIIDLHNGKIEVHSKPDEGSMFSVFLPDLKSDE